MRFDNQLMAPVALALLTALVVSFLMTPVVKSFAYKVGAIDVPKDERRMHHKPIPRLGGLAIFAGFMASILLFVDIRLNPQMQSILLGAVIIVVLGVVLIVNPFGAMETLVMAIGIILIVEGAINLLSALYTVLALRRFAKLHPETQSMLESLTGEDLNGDGVVAPDVTRTDAEASAVELDEVDESATVEQENEKD